MRTPPPVVTEHPLDAPESQELIGELNAELLSTNPDPNEHFFALSAEQVAPGTGAFVVAWLDGVAVGCGAFRMIDATTAEIKRMFVRPAGRGSRIGAAILAELERRARVAGASRVALETSERLTAAVALYRRAGFTPCACWGEYAAAPDSSCYEKPLRRLPS